MKRTLFTLLFTFILLTFATVAVNAAGQGQNDKIFESITFAPEQPYPGQEVVGTLTYLDATILGEKVTYEITYTNAAEGIEGKAVCPSSTCEFTPSTTANEAGKYVSELHFYAPEKEGTYTLVVSLTYGKEVTLTNELAPKSLVVETALPPSIAQLFAGLGLFAAVMAIMALGTEVVIEFGKFFLGLKAKVTAMDAFNELQKELPGQLTQLGVDSKTIKSLEQIYSGIKSEIQPISDWAAVYEKLQKGQFSEAFTALSKINELDSSNADAQKLLEKYKREAKLGLQKGFSLLRQKLPIDKQLVDQTQSSLLEQVDTVTIDSAKTLLENLLSKIQETVLAKEPEWIKSWLDNKTNELISHNKEHILSLAETNIFSTLEGLGFDDSAIDTIRKAFNEKLITAEALINKSANTYSTAVKNLLQAVENKRNETQSPARKLWRRLRKSRLPLWGVALIAWAIYALLWLINGSKGTVTGDMQNIANQQLWGQPVVWGAALAITVLGISTLLQIIFAYDINQQDQNLPGEYTLGYFMRYVLERGFNYILGRGSTIEDAKKYGQVDPNVEAEIDSTSSVTIAKTLLERDDKHRDEETSRIRILRIISIVVGTYLAYQLKIDSATYLNYAIPGIAEQINSVNLNLNQLWSAIPEDLTVGILLTGFAASAGSKFWRDLLGRLQAARGQAEEAAKLVSRVQSMLPRETNNSSQ